MSPLGMKEKFSFRHELKKICRRSGLVDWAFFRTYMP